MAYIGNTVENQGFTPAIDYFNGNGVTVTFTLSRPIASVAQLIVAIDNVIQNPSSSFTVAGNAITFSSAPLSGTNNIWVEYTSLITTYQGISQDPTVIGDIRATGGYLAEGDFGNSFVSGAILDYVTGLGRVTVGPAEGIALYNGGTAARTALMTVTATGDVGVGTTTPGTKFNVFTASTLQGLRIQRFAGAYYSELRQTDSPEGLAFLVGDGSTVAERARITGTGLMQFNSGYGSVATAYGCRAWVNFDGTGTVAIRASGNVSSITDNGTGLYTVNFTTAMPDANYAVVIYNNADPNTAQGSFNNNYTGGAGARTTTSVGVASYATSYIDSALFDVTIFR
jgi:hypothetical protein